MHPNFDDAKWESDAAEARKKFYELAEREGLKEAVTLPNNLKRDGMKEKVSPSHYKGRGMEVIDVIDAFDLDLYQGSIVQYVIRYKNKEGIVDLKKARWYLDRLIKKQEIADNKRPTGTTET